LIINSRDSLRLRDRWTEVGVTLFFWLFLLYLWQPLLSFLAWFFQGYVFYHHMIDLGGYASFASSARDYLLFILLLDGIFLIWARVNFWRFRDNERRGPVSDTSLQEHCDFFNANIESVEQWRHYKRMVVSFDEEGTIVTAWSGSLAEFKHQV
jgi:biofilm PGA synthesis protein PgaD